uniref:Uncharacterized protein n=1 Tax=Eptatretus burgeri TaxID=7764 RepID=A0A8C4NDA5_EPTBU
MVVSIFDRNENASVYFPVLSELAGAQDGENDGGSCVAFRRGPPGPPCLPSLSCRRLHSASGHLQLDLDPHRGAFLRWDPPDSWTDDWRPGGGPALHCLWRGLVTWFSCGRVKLTPSCGGFRLRGLHEGVEYVVCVTQVLQPEEADDEECMTFMLDPSPVRHVVVAMATVGGAVCVMLVLICLLVAYVTENMVTPPGHKDDLPGSPFILFYLT